MGRILGLAGIVLFLILLALFLPFRVEAQVPSVTLRWTAPGDDGNVGTASTYEMRYRSVGITGVDTLGWWNGATVVLGMPAPRVAGTAESVTITSGLNWGTTYYFIIKACDDGLPTNLTTPVPNCSGFSNLAVKVIGPAPDMAPPTSIFDLIVD